MHHPRKRFGQNFLVNPGIVAKIIAAIGPAAGDRVVEIGPGHGALTLPLMEKLEHLTVVEIDRDLVAELRRQHDPKHLTVVEADALTVDLSALGENLRLVGNLPYNISTPLLFHFAEHAEALRDLHLMLQKEVVDRMAAAPGNGVYGRLSVMVQYHFQVERLFTVPPGSFFPPPKVDSAVARLTPHRPLPWPADDEKRLAAIVAAAFSQRRKTLRNSLGKLLPPETIAACGIDPGLRAEALSVADFVALANHGGTSGPESCHGR